MEIHAASREVHSHPSPVLRNIDWIHGEQCPSRPARRVRTRPRSGQTGRNQQDGVFRHNHIRTCCRRLRTARHALVRATQGVGARVAAEDRVVAIGPQRGSPGPVIPDGPLRRGLFTYAGKGHSPPSPGLSGKGFARFQPVSNRFAGGE